MVYTCRWVLVNIMLVSYPGGSKNTSSSSLHVTETGLRSGLINPHLLIRRLKMPTIQPKNPGSPLFRNDLPFTIGYSKTIQTGFYWCDEKWRCSSYWFDKLDESFAELRSNLVGSKNYHLHILNLQAALCLTVKRISHFPFLVAFQNPRKSHQRFHADHYYSYIFLVLPQAFSFQRRPTKNLCLLEKEPLLTC